MIKEIFKLSSPIKAHGEEVTELEIRRPTIKEARAIKKLPYTLDDNGHPAADLEVAAKYLAVCAAIPAGSVDDVDLSDLNTLAWMIIGFFLNPVSRAPTT